MKLSSTVYHLKRKAKAIARREGIPLHAALDRIVEQEGFARWSLLVARISVAMHPDDLFSRLAAGDLLLLGARPGEGKTLMSLRLAAEAMKTGRPAIFFTLEYSARDVPGHFRRIGIDPARFGALFDFDCSDAISAATIIERLKAAPRGTFAVIDYLQLLDQKRENPDLMAQVRDLRDFAHEHGVTMVFLSQIDRAYDPAQKPCPDLDNVRLPNPLDLTLFDKACFMHGSQVRFAAPT